MVLTEFWRGAETLNQYDNTMRIGGSLLFKKIISSFKVRKWHLEKLESHGWSALGAAGDGVAEITSLKVSPGEMSGQWLTASLLLYFPLACFGHVALI